MYTHSGQSEFQSQSLPNPKKKPLQPFPALFNDHTNSNYRKFAPTIFVDNGP
jgi:hypothetical protein